MPVTDRTSARARPERCVASLQGDCNEACCPIGSQPTALDAMRETKNPNRINDLRLGLRRSGTSADVPGPSHMWSIITWKSRLSPRRITFRPRWHPPSPVKGPSIGNPPTFMGGARCTLVTWPNTEQDRLQCSSKDPAVKPLAGCRRNGHRPPGNRSSSAGLLSG